MPFVGTIRYVNKALIGVLAMTKRKHDARIRLRDASNALSEEVWEGKWDHLPEIRTKQIGECTEILKELERRCPGHSLEEYRDAYSRSMFTHR